MEVANAFTGYFEHLLNVQNPNDWESLCSQRTNQGKAQEWWQSVSDPPIAAEVRKAIRKFKNWKAPGPNGITAEVLKCAGEPLVIPLTKLLTQIWTSGATPTSWGLGTIVPIHKKDDRLVPANYRGICLLDIFYKTFAKILDGRIKKVVEGHGVLFEQQAGFRPGRGTRDQAHTLLRLIEKTMEYDKELFLCFVDLEKAYDSVPREGLFRVLEEEGAPEIVMKILRSVYSHPTAQVRIGKVLGRQFEIRTGVRQGCALSCILFNFVLNQVVKSIEPTLRANGVRLRMKEEGNIWKQDHPPQEREDTSWGLMYADDIAFTAASQDGLQCIMNAFHQALTKGRNAN